LRLPDLSGKAPDPALEAIGDLLDRIVTLDLKSRGAVSRLYEAARAVVGRPLSMQAAFALAGALDHGDTFVLATGFPVRPWISETIGETDGPPGVAALARAVIEARRAIPIVTAPPAMIAQVSAALQATGTQVLDFEAAQRAVRGARPTPAAVLVPFPIDATAAMVAAEQFLQRYCPRAIVAVEHPGANGAGVYHSSVGADISAATAKTEVLFAEARLRGILTVSFIDMPNEIGAGRVRHVAEETLPFARTCACPCGGGTAATSEVDVLVVGTTANWAAYGTVAALAVLFDEPSLSITAQHDRRAIEAVQSAGGVEGVSGSTWPESGVDGIPAIVSGRIVELLRMVAEDARAARERKPF
jgi:hypothetical protein